MQLLIDLDKPIREICPVCKSKNGKFGFEPEKPGFEVIDDQNIRQFRCVLHALLLMGLALEPLQTITREE